MSVQRVKELRRRRKRREERLKARAREQRGVKPGAAGRGSGSKAGGRRPATSG